MEYTILSIAFLIVFMLAYLLAKLDKLEGRLKATQQTVDQLAKQSGLPENPVNEELRALIRDDKDVKAVKKAREAFGFSLVEGKEYVDKLKADITHT